MLQALLLLLLAPPPSPAQALSGKYVRHSPEFLSAHPEPAVALPKPLPKDVAALCRLVAAGHRRPAVYAALGDGLLADKQGALAYRAFRRAHISVEGLARLRDAVARIAVASAGLAGRAPASLLVASRPFLPGEASQRRQLLGRMNACRAAGGGDISEKTILREEAEAREWVRHLQNYERMRLDQGLDPRDLAPFYDQYGRPEADLYRHMRARRASFLLGVVGFLLGLGACVVCVRLPRRAGLVLLVASGLLFAAPGWLSQAGILVWGAGASLAGATAVLVFGRRRSRKVGAAT